MKKMLIKISLFLLGVALIFTPYSIFLIVNHNHSHVYSKTYYAALVDKVHYLQSIKDQKKIILIGGSNVAFGFNSEILQNGFPDYKIVNFGLYAMLGTKIMMDLALDYVGPDDMVFLIPEINAQSTSLYFDPESTLKATEDDFTIVFKLPRDNMQSTIGKYFDFVVERNEHDSIIEPSGVYQRKNFNKYGDVEYFEDGESKRAKNKMPLYYDPSLMVDYSYKIDASFYQYLNSFSEEVSRKKAKCFYTWSPVNDLSVKCDSESIVDYYWDVRHKLSFPVIGNPAEYILDNHYFYDSNFHLNDSGAELRTLKMIEHYYRDVLQKYIDLSSLYPTKPDYESFDIDTSVNSDNYEDFFYNENNEFLEIVGVQNKELIESELPKVADHKVVIGIGESAFANSNLKKIVLPSTIHYIMDKAFSGSLIESVFIQSKDPEDIQVSWEGGLIEGALENILFYVPMDSVDDYKEDYFWSAYRFMIRGYDYEA